MSTNKKIYASTGYVDEAITAINFPVTTVNNKSGAVEITASDIGAVTTAELDSAVLFERGAVSTSIQSKQPDGYDYAWGERSTAFNKGYAVGNYTLAANTAIAGGSGSAAFGSSLHPSYGITISGEANATEYVSAITAYSGLTAAKKEYLHAIMKLSSSSEYVPIIDVKLDSNNKIIFKLARSLSDTALDKVGATIYKAGALGSRSFVAGHGAVARGENSYAAGFETVADGRQSVAFGTNTTATGRSTFVIGEFNKKNNSLDAQNTVVETFSAGSKRFSLTDGYIVTNPTPDYEAGVFNFQTETVPSSVTELSVGTLFRYSTSAATYYKIDEIVSSTETFVQAKFTTYTLGTTEEVRGNYSFIVGNGKHEQHCSNAMTLDWNGNARFDGDVYVQGTGTTTMSDAKKVATEAYVDTVVSNKMNKQNPTGTGSFSLNRKPNTSVGSYSFAEGNNTTASGVCSHAEGDNATASGNFSHAEGYETVASGDSSHAEGKYTVTIGPSSHAEGNISFAIGSGSHAEGNLSIAVGTDSHVEGGMTGSMGISNTITGAKNTKTYTYSGTLDTKVVVGSLIRVNNDFQPVKSIDTSAQTITLYNTLNPDADFIDQNISVVEPRAMGYASHAEGEGSKAQGRAAHTEGRYTIANGDFSHAEGERTFANGLRSHAEGFDTIASGAEQHVQGRHNRADTEEKYAHIVGNGLSYAPSNAHALDWEGNAYYAGNVYVNGDGTTNNFNGAKKVATEEYVNNAIANIGGGTPSVSNGLVLTDEATGQKYRVFINNGTLNMEVVE